MRRRNFPLLILPVILAGALGVYYAKFKFGHSSPAPEADAQRTEVVRSAPDQELQKFSLAGFNEGGESNWKLEGESAKIDPGQTVYLNENVTLRLRDNTLIRTDHVEWSQGGGTLKTDAIVTVEHENATVRGRGAFGRPDDGFIQLNRDIEMLINQSTKLTCLGPMKVFYNQNTMSFFRKVKVIDLKGVLTANRMDVTFDADSKKIKEITALGSVVIERGTDISRSQRAIYSVDTGAIRLEGNPEVTLNQVKGGLLDGALGN